MTTSRFESLREARIEGAHQIHQAAESAGQSSDIDALFEQFTRCIIDVFTRLKKTASEGRRIELEDENTWPDLVHPLEGSVTMGSLRMHQKALADLETAEQSVRQAIRSVVESFIEDHIAQDEAPDSLASNEEIIFENAARVLLPEIGYIEFMLLVYDQLRDCEDEIEMQHSIMELVVEDNREPIPDDPNQTYLFEL